MVQLTIVYKVDASSCRAEPVPVLPHGLLLQYIREAVLDFAWDLGRFRSTAKKRGVQVEAGLPACVVAEELHCAEV